MAKLSMIVNGSVFECDGGEVFVRAECDRFMAAITPTDTPEQAQDKPEVVREVRVPAVPERACKVIRQYELPVFLQLLREGVALNTGDSFKCELEGIGTVEFVITEVTDTTYRFESRDCLGESMKKRNVDTYLDKVFTRLPSELAELILDTERKHYDSDGDLFIKTRKLFLPSAAEIFPEEDCYGDKGLYQQMEWYKDCHNRIRGSKHGSGVSTWYWTDSPYSGYSGYYCVVYSSGGASSINAGGSNGVAPGFCIRRS